MMCFCIAWWLCITVVSQSILAQQSQDRDSYHRCYNLTTAMHCFKAGRTGRTALLKSFTEAIDWCDSHSQGYALAKIESAEVQTAVERFLEEFELTRDNVWIAARKSTREEWTWVNGDVFSNGNFLLSFYLVPASRQTARYHSRECL